MATCQNVFITPLRYCTCFRTPRTFVSSPAPQMLTSWRHTGRGKRCRPLAACSIQKLLYCSSTGGHWCWHSNAWPRTTCGKHAKSEIKNREKTSRECQAVVGNGHLSLSLMFDVLIELQQLLKLLQAHPLHLNDIVRFCSFVTAIKSYPLDHVSRKNSSVLPIPKNKWKL
jgi:hypothetical protein